MTPEAERFNGWAAMIGVIAAIGSYATTGQLIPEFGERYVIHSNISHRRVYLCSALIE